MNFIFKLSIKEMIRNKLKVIIAIIVSLILFMSAFTLCNIATALPSNFHNYYESFMNDSIGVYVMNADEALYKNSANYFTEFRIESDKACVNFSLKNGELEQLPYEEKDIDGSIYTTLFNNILLDKNLHEATWYSSYFTQGTAWKDFNEEGIWLADFAAEQLQVKVGDTIEYSFNNALIKLKVNGIFDSEKLQNELSKKNGSKVNKYISFINEVSARKILFESKTQFEAYGVVGKINKLYQVYNSLSKSYSLSEGAAFGLVKQVKNAEVICYIVGIIMMIGGIVILLNFINMIMSSNKKHISLMRILGAKTFKIIFSYYILFMFLISIVCLISWATLPLYNYIVSVYCAGMGYPFSIGINYAVVMSVFGACYLITTLVMLIKWQIMEATTPGQNILEED